MVYLLKVCFDSMFLALVLTFQVVICNCFFENVGVVIQFVGLF